MKQRILTALWLIPLALLWMFAANDHVFAVGAAALLALASWEWGKFVCPAKPLLYAPAPVLCALGGCIALNPFSPSFGASVAASPVSVALLSAGALWWVIALALVLLYPRNVSLVRNPWLAGTAGILVLTPFFWSLLYLHAMHPAAILPFESGGANLFFVMLLVWCADSGAYFAGKAFGRHRMSPAVSPNKTLEGLAGGVLLSLAAALGAGLGAVKDGFAVNGWFVAAVTLAVAASVLGDLAESMFKRASGIKDSSNLLPGHGGVLDRVDSLTAALPVFSLVMYLGSGI